MSRTPKTDKDPAPKVKTPRKRTTQNLYDKKPAKIVQLVKDALLRAIGRAEMKGIWVIYGKEKNGKTTLALMLAKDLAINERVGYISAEEGLDLSFQENCRRAGITTGDDILWDEYLTIDQIIEEYSKPRQPRIIFIDNLVIYQDELKPSEIKSKLLAGLPNKLIILMGHEERGEPYPALTRMASKLAKVIFHVQGLKAMVVSRYSKGGEIVIDEDKCELYHGSSDINEI